MKLLYALLIFFISFEAYSQKALKGIVLDAEKNAALSNASVFLNTTAIGTITDAQGNFSLAIPNGRYELIISAIGYETYAQTINASDAADFITVKLKIKVQEMETVVVGPYEKNGWAKWGRFFLESFIGTSDFARDCTIKNAEVIKFRFIKNKELSAYADEPLIIENKALGYTLRYQLESFQYNFDTKYLFHTGFPFFQPMQGKANALRRWERNRNEAYTGSIMHFMRAVYRNKISDEGFEVMALKKIPNAEKERIKAVYAGNTPRGNLLNDGRAANSVYKDSSDYYRKVMQQPDYTSLVDTTLLPGDSIAYAVNATTAGIDFENYLLVIYNKQPPAEYRQQYAQAGAGMMSEITLINKRPIEIQANGSYFNPIDLMSTGYWAWSEKIAALLPFDFKPK